MDQQEKEDTTSTTSITLPPEIWLEILSRCSYFDLKKAQRVCKSFNELIKTPRFDSLLFRAQPDLSTLTTKTRPLLHPVLKQLNLVTETLENIVSYGKTKEHVVADLNVCSEMATFPSSSKVSLKNFGQWGRSISNEDERGVTVGQLLDNIIELWSNDAGDEGFGIEEVERAYEEALYGVDRKDKEAVVEACREAERKLFEPRSCLEALRSNTDHSFFEGWYAPKVESNGRIVLSARPFGS
ncbi:hypothetical protein BCR35DRAFT_330219 [Leucosporidium creatinivorum]|uniref:F-box domain-containing protein n=1 Tax=Leucosporidium creatinivorum TaxID=106004 RepID=A0A1Y2FXU0_9BASI|nr:hypothetical protein BCR35DRAFT_330219 [Leucosporidium creatinivorum]